MSKFVSGESAPSTKSELDLFTVPATQVAVEKTRWLEVHLDNPCTSNGPFDFHIPPGPLYLQLNKNYLLMEVRIMDHDGTPLDAQSPHVAPINLIGKTLFRQVKLSLNGTEVYDSGDKYHYRSYIETELNYDDATKNTQLGFSGYTKEEPNNAGSIDLDTNVAFRKRAAAFAASKWVQLYTPLTTDLFAQDRVLINHMDLRLSLSRNSDAFALLCYSDGTIPFKLEIRRMVWYVKTVSVISSVSLALERTLLTHTCKYPLRRVEVKILHVSNGRQSTPENALWNGQIPRRLVVGCLNSNAVVGSYIKSPFNFKNFKIKEISVVVGGEIHPAQPIITDFDTGDVARAYTQLFEGLGIAGEDKSNGITPAMFVSGSCFFAFDLSADEDDGSHFSVIKEGATTICIKFGEAVATPGIDIVCFAEFDNMLEIDKHRNVFLDYKA
jgi:hypothetical protein